MHYSAEFECTDNIIEFIHPDNLRSTYHLNCIELVSVEASYTPADLVNAVITCAQEGKFSTSIQLFFAYSVFGVFYQLRVEDTTALGATSVLNSEIFYSLTEAEVVGIRGAMTELADENGELFKQTCRILSKLGKPNYTPYYMLAHGLDAFDWKCGEMRYLEKTELLEKLLDVDESDIWHQGLHEINKCPE